MKEEWKIVPDWDLYEVSNMGRLRGRDRVIKNNKGTYVRKGRLLKPVMDKYGYYTFWFKQDGRKKNMKIHRIVAQCFIPNPENKPCVNHIDNNPSNNRVDNLEWCTMKENTAWMMKQGRSDRTPEWLDNLHKSQEPSYKAVKGINMYTGETIYFERLNAVKEAGFQPSCVCLCCKNKNGITQHLGYQWEYISNEEYESAITNPIKNTLLSQLPEKRKARVFLTRKVQNITTGECFDSVKQAAETYGFSSSGLARAVKKGWNAGGCKWRYLSDSRDNSQLVDIHNDEDQKYARNNQHSD